MSKESRLLRGDNPEDVARIFGISLDDCKAILAKSNKPAVKKKAAKKRTVKSKA